MLLSILFMGNKKGGHYSEWDTKFKYTSLYGWLTIHCDLSGLILVWQAASEYILNGLQIPLGKGRQLGMVWGVLGK